MIHDFAREWANEPHNEFMNERASEDPIINKTKTKKMKQTQSREIKDGQSLPPVENMKPKPGTAKPSGAGVGKGGPKTSPTDGGSLKVKGGKGKKK